jgi:hypothetical protein
MDGLSPCNAISAHRHLIHTWLISYVGDSPEKDFHRYSASFYILAIDDIFHEIYPAILVHYVIQINMAIKCFSKRYHVFNHFVQFSSEVCEVLCECQGSSHGVAGLDVNVL